MGERQTQIGAVPKTVNETSESNPPRDSTLHHGTTLMSSHMSIQPARKLQPEGGSDGGTVTAVAVDEKGCQAVGKLTD